MQVLLKNRIFTFGLVGLLVCVIGTGSASSQSTSQRVLDTAHTELVLIAKAEYPNIKTHKLYIKELDSEDTFFQARYSIWRYSTFQPMRHLVYVNPRIKELKLPREAMTGILAHELAHVDYYTRKNRLQLLGLIRLANSSAQIGFERKADLEAIIRGFGEGLIKYRQWLYINIPEKSLADKKRTYFTPQEIDMIRKAIVINPDLIVKWRKDVPKNLAEIEADIRE